MARNILIAGGAAGVLAAGMLVRARSRKQYDFAKKRVLITGGSRGLGFLLARKLLERKAYVAVCARSEGELRQVRKEFKKHGRRFMTARCDITDPDAVEKMTRNVKNRLGDIDMLINNAGIISVGPLETMDIHDYRRVMEINFFGALNTTFNVLPEMRRRKEGRIVNIVSAGGKVSMPHLLPYNVSKFAFSGFSEGLYAEVAKDNIRVTTVYPGNMRTGSPVNAEFKGRHEEEYAWFATADSVPFFSIDAERAAEKIIRAAQLSKPVVILTVPAKIGLRLHGLAPGLGVRLLAAVNRRFLPPAGGIGKKSAKGKESFSKQAPSRLTRWSDEASTRHNEISRTEFKERAQEAEEREDS